MREGRLPSVGPGTWLACVGAGDANSLWPVVVATGMVGSGGRDAGGRDMVSIVPSGGAGARTLPEGLAQFGGTGATAAVPATLAAGLEAW